MVFMIVFLVKIIVLIIFDIQDPDFSQDTVISSLVINSLLSLFLNSIGIIKCTFAVPIGFITIAGVGLIFLSFGIACLLSLKIKKIVSLVLLVGE